MWFSWRNKTTVNTPQAVGAGEERVEGAVDLAGGRQTTCMFSNFRDVKEIHWHSVLVLPQSMLPSSLD